MSEQVRRFRQALEENAIRSYGEDRAWWDSLPDEQKSWEVANAGMGYSFGNIKAIRDPYNLHREHDEETLRLIAQKYGLTIEEYTRVLIDLREELRGQLSPEDWEIFFGTTTDIT